MHRITGALTAAVLSLAVGCDDGSMTTNNPDGSDGTCTDGEYRCQDNNVEVCKDGAWTLETACTTGTQTCQVVGGKAVCTEAQSCNDGQKNQDESDVDCGGNVCEPCGEGKACQSDSDCESGACEGGTCQPCKAGTTSCLGNLVRVCKSDNSGWDTVATCDPAKGEVCDAATQTCEQVQVTGKATPTGTYYLFSMFKTGESDFKGGYDVDSYVDVVEGAETNYIYVNNKSKLDVYKVELIDSDGDGKLEPHQHPKNPKEKGPIEERKLTFLKTYPDVTLGQPSRAEIYAQKDRIRFIKKDPSDSAPNIYEYVFATGKTSLVIKGNPKVPLVLLGLDGRDGRWYGGYDRTIRRVYSYYPDGGGWAVEFDYPNLAGSHQDGMEVVMDPKEEVTYVYVSDMTSDFLAQYYRDKTTGKWVQKNVFEYQETENQHVEGMGFGAFQHFWATSGKAVYEVGGGDLQKYVGPDIK